MLSINQTLTEGKFIDFIDIYTRYRDAPDLLVQHQHNGKPSTNGDYRRNGVPDDPIQQQIDLGKALLDAGPERITNHRDLIRQKHEAIE